MAAARAKAAGPTIKKIVRDIDRLLRNVRQYPVASEAKSMQTQWVRRLTTARKLLITLCLAGGRGGGASNYENDYKKWPRRGGRK